MHSHPQLYTDPGLGQQPFKVGGLVAVSPVHTPQTLRSKLSSHQSLFDRLHLYPTLGTQYLTQIQVVRESFPTQLRLAQEYASAFFSTRRGSTSTLSPVAFSHSLSVPTLASTLPIGPRLNVARSQYQRVDVIPATEPLLVHRHSSCPPQDPHLRFLLETCRSSVICDSWSNESSFPVTVDTLHWTLEQRQPLADRRICRFVTLIVFALGRVTALYVQGCCPPCLLRGLDVPRTDDSTMPFFPFSTVSSPGPPVFPIGSHVVTARLVFYALLQIHFFEVQMPTTATAPVKVLDGVSRCLLTNSGPVVHMAHKVGHSASYLPQKPCCGASQDTTTAMHTHLGLISASCFGPQAMNFRGSDDAALSRCTLCMSSWYVLVTEDSFPDPRCKALRCGTLLSSRSPLSSSRQKFPAPQ